MIELIIKKTLNDDSTSCCCGNNEYGLTGIPFLAEFEFRLVNN